MTYFALILGLFLLGVAVTMVIRALVAPAGPSTETIEQISAYGFAGSIPASSRKDQGPGLRTRLDDLATSAGTLPRATIHAPPREGLPRQAHLGRDVRLHARAPARHAAPVGTRVCVPRPLAGRS